MFTGVGEKLDELDEFHPDRMASRILGMGDVLSLIERVESEMDQKKAEEAARKLEENRFDMNDLLEQFRQIKKMGSLKSILSMLPGMAMTTIRAKNSTNSAMHRPLTFFLSTLCSRGDRPPKIRPIKAV